MDKKLLDILVCPVTKGPLIYDKKNQELISTSARLAYPIKDDIPVMLEDEARTLTDEEIENKLTFLIAEDEEVNFMFMEILLLEKLKIDCHIIHAKNGKEAVEICQNNANIDLVLMDLKMPILTGFEATKLIKEFRPNLPIIALSAYSSDKDKKNAKVMQE